MHIVNSLDEKIWRSHVDQHQFSNIFHTPEMFHVFEGAKGYHPQLYAVVDNKETIQSLLLPVQITLIDGLLRRLTSRAIVYGSVLSNLNAQSVEALSILLRNYTQSANNQVLFTEFRNLSDLSSLQPLLIEHGYTFSEYLDFHIDLSCSSEQVLQNIGARTRKHIRQGLRKQNVFVELLSERAQLPIWYDLISRTYQNVRIPLADRTLFESAFDILQPLGMVQFWLARIGSVYVAATAELLYKNVMYGWYSGVDRSFANESPGELLMWHILEWGSQNGYKTYEFGGAGKPDQKYGVRDFKAKFGGTLVCYGRNTKIHSPKLLQLSEKGYQVYRQLFGNL